MANRELVEEQNEQMIRKIWNHYGEDAQTNKFIEELSELIIALTKNDIESITEEMGDVEVMIAQFKSGLDIDTTQVINYKLKRTMRRIAEEE